MSKVRAKVVCRAIEDVPEGEYKNVFFHPVTDGSEENKSFSKYTPSGDIHLAISHDTEASNAFEEGKEYYVDFSEAE